MTIRRVRRSVWVWACRCVRCAYTWDSIAKEKPTRCPGCKSHAFGTPARPYRRRKKRTAPRA